MSGPTPAAGPQTLTCAQVAALVFDFSEGELTDDQHALVAEHLSLCADCADFVRTYSAVGRLVRHAMEVQVDPELQAELDAAIFGALAVTA